MVVHSAVTAAIKQSSLPDIQGPSIVTVAEHCTYCFIPVVYRLNRTPRELVKMPVHFYFGLLKRVRRGKVGLEVAWGLLNRSASVSIVADALAATLRSTVRRYTSLERTIHRKVTAQLVF
jgi:hypothetical protein